jgi:hypothetical protein
MKSRIRLSVVAAVVLARALSSTAAWADVRAIWAIGDGDKVDRDEVAHPGRQANAVWDGTRVRVFGARNEIVAF